MSPLTTYMVSCRDCGGLTPRAASRTCLHCDAPLRAPGAWAWKLTALLGPAGAILLAACYGGPGRYHANMPSGPDNDGDGVQNGTDCDDADPARYPGAPDLVGDGVDQDCDGVDGHRDSAGTSPPATIAVPPTP
ncbi:MAG: putative metal-binding motif-containing protein [Kofleriaceae bacterium]